MTRPTQCKTCGSPTSPAIQINANDEKETVALCLNPDCSDLYQNINDDDLQTILYNVARATAFVVAFTVTFLILWSLI